MNKFQSDEPEEDGDEEGGDDEAGGESGGDDEEEDEDEEEPVDPVEELREKCGESSACAKLKEIFDTCTERVNSRSNTEETCAQELLDFVHCQDVCVSVTELYFSNCSVAALYKDVLSI